MVIRREDRHDRQRLAGWSPETLANARVVVVGAGAIGNEVVKNLVLIGVGTIVVVDLDLVAPSNLTRCVLMRESDVGKSKAEVVAERAMALNPAVCVIPIHGDLEYVLGDAYLAEADIVIGCLDNAYARYVLNRRVRRLQRPWLDTAISHDAVQVSWIDTGGACYACGLSELTFAALRKRFSCTGLRAPVPAPVVPTTVVTAALSGAFAADLAVNTLHGDSPSGSRRWSLFVRATRWIEDSLSVGDSCAFHGDTATTVVRPWERTQVATWAELAERLDVNASATLSLPEPVVTRFSCAPCGEMRDRVGPKSSIPHELSICGTCSEVMDARETTEVGRNDELARVAFAQLGIAAGSRLQITDEGQQFTVELATDPRWSR